MQVRGCHMPHPIYLGLKLVVWVLGKFRFFPLLVRHIKKTGLVVWFLFKFLFVLENVSALPCIKSLMALFTYFEEQSFTSCLNYLISGLKLLLQITDSALGIFQLQLQLLYLASKMMRFSHLLVDRMLPFGLFGFMCEFLKIFKMQNLKIHSKWYYILFPLYNRLFTFLQFRHGINTLNNVNAPVNKIKFFVIITQSTP